mmetsp:Transcript_8857/g.26546  ORF Transcript_8857/g.26546 Transcript_8857/m.26546 type:complete len:332 (-) Transcript_8857:41-1036(-)
MVHASSSTNTIIERVDAMRLIEASSAYQCHNYFNEKTLQCSAEASNRSEAVDASSRAKMIEWMFSIVDCYGFDRDTVSVATSVSDRFLSKETVKAREVLRNQKQFQIVFITALHIAVKMREPVQMDGSLLSQLSRGTYSAQDFIDCERQLISGVQWRVNCPTVMEFVHEFLSFLPRNGLRRAYVENHVLLGARRMSELAISDLDCIAMKPSDVALAVISESVEDVSYIDFPSRQRREFFALVEETAGKSINSEAVSAAHAVIQKCAFNEFVVRTRAVSSHNMSECQIASPTEEAKEATAESSQECSPVCISRLSLGYQIYSSRSIGATHRR